jgi:hypothetical protein
MAISDMILQKLEPKIAPPSFDVRDLESKDSTSKFRSPESSGYAKELGRKAPLIRVGSVRLEQDSIIAMEVYQNGLIPTIHVSFIDSTGSFTSVGYPKTNPIVTAFVARTHPKLKSFAQSFLITNIHSIPIGDFMVRYDMYGELYVPSINSNFVKAYRGVGSSGALQKVAEELGLGFATNEDTTNDTMTWINPNLNYKGFINSVKDRAYKNETNFFDCFIDRYYVLNFINVEKQFKRGDDIDYGYAGNQQNYIDMSRADSADDELMNQEPIPILLSNSTHVGPGSELRIISYSLAGDNGEVLKRSGFRKRGYLYKHGETDPVKSWFIEPISSSADPAGQVHQTPLLTDFVENEVVKWMGLDYGNAHSNYKFAKLINHHNHLETDKNNLIVNLNGFNHSILRGGRVAVKIYNTMSTEMNNERFVDDKKAKDPDMNTKGKNVASNPEYLDRYLSDSYYVKEVSYAYNSSTPETPFTTQLVLSRRNWYPEPLLENN